MFNLINYLQSCRDIVSLYVPVELMYYAHIAPILVSLFIGFFVFKKQKSLQTKILLIIILLFSIWSILDLITWVNYSAEHIMFAWSALGIFNVLFFAFCYYFLRVFFRDGKDITFFEKIILLIISLPIVIMTPTINNLSGFDYVSCEAQDRYFLGYIFIAELFLLISALIYFIYYRFVKKIKDIKKAIIFLGIFIFWKDMSFVIDVIYLFCTHFDYLFFHYILIIVIYFYCCSCFF